MTAETIGAVVEDFHKTLLELRPDGSVITSEIADKIHKLREEGLKVVAVIEAPKAPQSRSSREVKTDNISREVKSIANLRNDADLTPSGDFEALSLKAHAIDPATFTTRVNGNIPFVPVLAINPLTISN